VLSNCYLSVNVALFKKKSRTLGTFYTVEFKIQLIIKNMFSLELKFCCFKAAIGKHQALNSEVMGNFRLYLNIGQTSVKLH